MKNNDKMLEMMIKEEYEREAQEEEAALLEADDIIMPAGKKEALYLKISEEIEKLEKAGLKASVDTTDKMEEEEKTEDQMNREGKKLPEQHENLYANMSEEDLKALAIGRRILEEEEKANRERKVVRKKKKRMQMYVGLAAALVLAMTAGLTSMGGPEKIIKMVTRMIGDRQVEKVNSSEDNLILVNEDEEEAYQKISDEFGIMPTKVVIVSDKMKFVNMKLDEVLQTAELYYDYDGKRLSYLICASYKKASLGFEIVDEVIDEYTMEVYGREIEIKKYQVAEEDVKKYSASFKDMGLKYFLYGTMEQPEFELIVENLHFF